MRSFCCACLLFVVALATTAAAQEVDFHRFYPLDLGDTWDYRVFEEDCVFSDCETEFEGYERRTVVADTMIADEPWKVLRVERLSLDAEVLKTGRCVARVAADGEVHFEHIDASCNAMEIKDNVGDLWNLQEGVFDEVDAVVEIGGVEYGVDVLRHYREGMMGETIFPAATDIGVVEYVGNAGPDQSRDYWSGELVYAEVGGVVYGTHPVANEGEAAPAAFVLGAAYPNPFRSTVTFALNLPAAEAATLEAFDVLGRRVLDRDLGVQPTGETRHTLDGRALPPGVYFVRVTTASGQQATRRVVRVE